MKSFRGTTFQISVMQLQLNLFTSSFFRRNFAKALCIIMCLLSAFPILSRCGAIDSFSNLQPCFVAFFFYRAGIIEMRVAGSNEPTATLCPRGNLIYVRWFFIACLSSFSVILLLEVENSIEALEYGLTVICILKKFKKYFIIFPKRKQIARRMGEAVTADKKHNKVIIFSLFLLWLYFYFFYKSRLTSLPIWKIKRAFARQVFAGPSIPRLSFRVLCERNFGAFLCVCLRTLELKRPS